MTRHLEYVTPWEVVVVDPPKGIGAMDELVDAEVIFVCVGTPWVAGSFDQSAVEIVLAQLDDIVDVERMPVAVRSTILPGFLEETAKHVPNLELFHAPEFLVERDPDGSMARASRIVVGGDKWKATHVTDVLRIISPDARVAYVSWNEAALIKLCANALLASRVAMANELGAVCDEFGVDWHHVKEIVGADERIGRAHLERNGSGGFGGRCLSKDLKGLMQSAYEQGMDPQLLEALLGFARDEWTT
jgi:nucleotide sugar dehydrogenase